MYKPFGKYFKSCMDEFGDDKETVSYICGVAVSTVDSWCCGRLKPQEESIEILCERWHKRMLAVRYMFFFSPLFRYLFQGKFSKEDLSEMPTQQDASMELFTALHNISYLVPQIITETVSKVRSISTFEAVEKVLSTALIWVATNTHEKQKTTCPTTDGFSKRI